jgi:hypothetical protein
MGDAARSFRHEDSTIIPLPHPAITILAPEAIRAGTAPLPAPSAKGEDRMSLFWRIFGGTLLSLAGLGGLTIYQQLNNSITEVRNEVNRINEGRGELVKKEELAARTTTIWNGIKDLQSANGTVTALKEREGVLEQQLKASEDERREMSKEIQKLRERLAALEGRQPGPTSKPD